VRRVAPLSAAALLLALTACAKTDQPPVAAAPAGTFQGIRAEGVRQFLGIRYAASPEGARRWQPPAEPPPVSGTIDASKFGAHCPQAASDYGIESATEDCLFLNVYAPDRAGSQAPVLVWIHGGALVVGESEDFDPSVMARKTGAVVATINYRLGALGWLAVRALDAEGRAFANYGLMDQQAALRWVQRNIAAFGGDPGKVTIFGESAGGLSVLLHLVSPGSAGLFHRAIVESGAYVLRLPTVADAEAEGARFATESGCADGNAACVRKLPVATILQKETQLPIPPVDGQVIRQSLDAAFAAGAFSRVPILEGTTHDEFRLFVGEYFDLAKGPVTADQYPEVLASRFPKDAVPRIVAEYPLAGFASPDIAAAQSSTDKVFACTADLVARAHAAWVPTFAYEFSDPSPPQNFLAPAQMPYGASHESEVQFLMGVRSRPDTAAMTPAETRLSDQMIRYWVDFAASGDPNGSGLPPWPRYAAGTQQVQTLAPPDPKPMTGFAEAHHCRFWSDLGVLGLP